MTTKTNDLLLDVREIESITFGIFSTSDILKMAVAEINSTKLTGGLGTVYDDRMGTIDNGKTCVTCLGLPKDCPGHFGYIQFNEAIINPLFYKETRTMLSCFCISCYRTILTEDQMNLTGLNKSKGKKRYLKYLARIEKIDECCYCGHPQPEFKFSTTDNNISMVYKQKGNNKVSIILSVDEIKKIFNNVSDNDVKLLGFEPEIFHPRNYIMELFPVIPPVSRPYVMADGNLCDDDLTNQIIEIIKCNNHLSKEKDPTMSESKKQKYLQSLKFRVATFMNNSSSKAKHNVSGRAIKGLKERLTGN